MPLIAKENLSKVLNKNETSKHFSDKLFIVDSTITINNLSRVYSFRNCVFYFETLGTLTIQGINLKNCQFIGFKDKTITDNPNINGLHLLQSTMSEGITLSNHFNYINIGSITIDNLTDYSITKSTKFYSSQFINSTIEGQTDKLRMNDTIITSSRKNTTVWNKKIRLSAYCKNVTFENTKVNPYYLATKCDDKSSLDISQSTLIDDWSKLRKNYAGINMVIVFALTFVFFLPILTQSFFLLLSAKINLAPTSFNEIPLWEALLWGGKNGISAMIYSVLTVLLILFNLGRLWMTISIAKLREEEQFLKDADFKLISIPPEKIVNHVKIDKVLVILLWLSVIYATLKLLDTLMIQVPIYI